jgi:hypothetical protein
MRLKASIALTMFLLLPMVWAQDAASTKKDKPETIRDAALKPDKIAEKIANWPECDEYKSAERCKVTIYLGKEPQPDKDAGPFMPHAHWDVQVKPFIFLSERPRGEAVVVLQQSSPFMQCTVAATPAAPTRDLSANIGTALTAVGAIGAVPAARLLTAMPEGELIAMADSVSSQIDKNAELRNLAHQPGPSATLQQIETEIQALARQINDPAGPYNMYRKAVQDDWKYTFTENQKAKDAIDDLKTKTAAALIAPLPDFAGYTAKLQALMERLNAYQALPSELEEVAKDKDLVTMLEAEVGRVAGAMKDEQSRRKTMRQLYDFLWTIDVKSKLTEQLAPMAYFSGKSVTETVTCKDAISNNPAFDNIIFTAYYEGLPHFDISAGALFSLLGGRQVGSVTQPWSATDQAMCNSKAPMGSTTPCGPGTTLAYTSKSWYQFMPGVFFEWRAVNFLPGWVKNGSPVHKLGYLWSFGPAFGIDINPNNGTTEAEFFEGISLGIQRFTIMAGFHDGRYQQYGGGFYVGEAFPTGAMVTPPIVRNWAVRPAFGIAYRIPIR